MKKAWEILKLSFKSFGENKVMKLSASLAYYTVFSIPGLLMVMFWVIRSIYKNKTQEAQEAIYHQFAEMIGPNAANQINTAFENASQFSGWSWATTIAVVTLVFGATSIFTEIHDSINFIWNLKAKPKKGRGILKFLANRLLSLSMVMSLGFLLMVSLILNTVMDIFFRQLTQYITSNTIDWAYISNFILTFIVTTSLFAIIYKVLPDAKVKWRTVAVGAMTTAILFMLGKALISYFLTNNRISSAYGAAGSVIIILLWVYYTAAILYFGAAFTKAYATVTEHFITPSSYAVWVEQIEVESKENMHKAVETKEKIVETAEKVVANNTDVEIPKKEC